MVLISVIVPVYNAEKHLSRCIDSILNQTFSNFELLLIDDGSKDSSGTICEKYAKQDYRVIVFHQSNAGVSATRNCGLNRAIGDWIIFVDADDYLYSDALDNLFRNSTADLIVAGYTHYGILSNKNVLHSPAHMRIDIKNNGSILKQTVHNYLTTPWCKLFSRKIICKNNLKFDETLFYGEDTDFIFRYLYLVNSIQFVSNPVYHYCDAENSFWKYNFNASSFKKIIRATNRNFSLLEEKTNESFLEIQSTFLRDYSSLYLRSLIRISNYADFSKEIKAYKKEKCVCSVDSFKFKTLVAIFRLSPFFAYCCIRLYQLRYLYNIKKPN